MPLLVLLLAGCATRVVDTSSRLPVSGAASPLPVPRRIVVADFAADGAQLSLDQGIGPRLQRSMQGSDPGADQQLMLDDVRNAIADALVADIRKMGLPAERASETARFRGGDTLLVQGRILRVDQGNRTRRLGIGFGAGKSDVAAAIQVSYRSDGGPARVVQTYDADSNSGRKPGLAFGAASLAGGGSVAPALLGGAASVGAERRQTEVVTEAGKLAHRVAYNLGAFFVRQGWIAPSAAPTLSLR